MKFKKLKLVTLLSLLITFDVHGERIEDITDTPQTTKTFNDLPKDIIGEIVQFLPLKDFGNFLTLNKEMKDYAVQSFKNYNFVELTSKKFVNFIKFISAILDEDTAPFLNLSASDLGPKDLENIISNMGNYTKTLHINNRYNYEKATDLLFKKQIGFHFKYFTLRQSVSSSLKTVLQNPLNFIGNLKELTCLDVSYNDIGNHGAHCISSLPELTDLSISNNQIYDDGAKHISTLLKLKKLNISNNKIGDAGALSISSLPNLTNLTISNNKLVDKDFVKRLFPDTCKVTL